MSIKNLLKYDINPENGSAYHLNQTNFWFRSLISEITHTAGGFICEKKQSYTIQFDKKRIVSDKMSSVGLVYLSSLRTSI